jgi:hypothetical protein
VSSFLAASSKDFPSTLSFHAFAKSVFLVTAPHMRLKSAFRQRSSPRLCIVTQSEARTTFEIRPSSAVCGKRVRTRCSVTANPMCNRND